MARSIWNHSSARPALRQQLSRSFLNKDSLAQCTAQESFAVAAPRTDRTANALPPSAFVLWPARPLRPWFDKIIAVCSRAGLLTDHRQHGKRVVERRNFWSRLERGFRSPANCNSRLLGLRDLMFCR